MQFIHCRIEERRSAAMNWVTFMYGDTMSSRRTELWESLETVAASVRGAWLMLGDFNTFLNQSDKVGGSPPNSLAISQFRECINSCNLLEVLVVGDKFTWERNEVKERLDWALCNFDWELANPHFKVFHQLRFKSDHSVIVVSNSSGNGGSGRPQSFQYQAAWCLEPEFPYLVKSSWETRSWLEGKQEFEAVATEWNARAVGSIPKKKREILKGSKD